MAYGFSVREASPFAAHSHQSFNERLIVEPPLVFLKHCSQTQQVPRTGSSSWAPLLLVCMLLGTVAAASYVISPSAVNQPFPAAATWLRQNQQQEQSLQQWQTPATVVPKSAIQHISSKTADSQNQAHLLQQEQQPVVENLPGQAPEVPLQTADSRHPVVVGFAEHITIWYTKPMHVRLSAHGSSTTEDQEDLGHRRFEHRKVL